MTPSAASGEDSAGDVAPQARDEPPPRVAGLDVARAVAILLMIQTHAYDGWLAPEARTGLAFRLSRELGTLPLPMFLGLAGLGLGLRTRRALARSEPASALRRGLVRGALAVVAWGYALNLAYALLDGGDLLGRLWRIDVLHAIGLSLLVLSLTAVGAHEAPPCPRRFVRACALAALAALALCPMATRLGHAATGMWRPALAPFAEVPGQSSMPLIPLLAFCALGTLLGFVASVPLAPWQRRLLPWLALAALVIGITGTQLLAARGVRISRASPNIWLNALELTGRAAIAIALVSWLTPWLGRALSAWVALGQRSLLVYGAHLPFCYGRFARPIKGALSFSQASVVLCLLTLACVGLALARGERRVGASKIPPRALS